VIVIIAGMYRSGSTFTYNVTRELLLNSGHVDCYAADTFDELLMHTPNQNHVLIKTHQPSDLMTRLIMHGGVKCISSTRKPEDAIASWMHVFNDGLDHSISIMSAWLHWYMPLSNRLLNIQYQTIDNFPYLATLAIQWHLFKRINPITAYKVTRKYNKKKIKDVLDTLTESKNTQSTGFSYYDKTTFFHRKHISSIKSAPANERLTIEQIELIREKLSTFVDSSGNLLKGKQTNLQNDVGLNQSFSVSFSEKLIERDKYIEYLKNELVLKDSTIDNFNAVLKDRYIFIEHLKNELGKKNNESVNFTTALKERDDYIEHLKAEVNKTTNDKMNELHALIDDKNKFIIYLENTLAEKASEIKNLNTALNLKES
jgi:hypothetical protein